MYKLPILVGNDNPQWAAGYGYAYMDSTSVKQGFVPQTTTSLADSNIALAYTLAQIYDAATTSAGNSTNVSKSQDVGWVLYNDEKPDGSTSSYRGHTKGAAAFDSAGGFFLDHSVPRWPPDPETDAYEFNDFETTYGQSFLCTTLDAPNLDVVFGQWEYTYPNWYSTSLPDTLEPSYLNLALVLSGQHVSAAPWASVATFTTRGGQEVTYVAKYSTWDEDFYEDLVSPTLGVGLLAETWQNGGGKLPSFCGASDGGSYAYTVENVVAVDLGSGATFTETKDHSKWAVSVDPPDAYTFLWACVGDLNRQSGQESRAGGTLCIHDADLWRAYNGTIASVEACG